METEEVKSNNDEVTVFIDDLFIFPLIFYLHVIISILQLLRRFNPAEPLVKKSVIL